ncbi:MAG: hypothetical protein K9J79_02480 [Desulfobacteraceae bacterium]|nr:hypothetical protein [Desulfobacteraceae bacterium]
MNENTKNESWIYVAVEDPGGDENFMGLYDEKTEVSYIPAFKEKEDALSCMLNLPRRTGKKYEVQAVMLDHLAEDARRNEFLIFVLDGKGRILEQIEP